MVEVQNNKKMDELIDKLGYMDFRDALACNKYILEAKISQDYGQVARAKVLETAFKTLDERQKVEFQNKVARKVG